MHRNYKDEENIVDKIARQLASSQTLTQIKNFLKRFGIDELGIIASKHDYVIDLHKVGRAMLLHQLVQYAHHTLAAQAGVHFNGQALPTLYVQHVQGAKPPAIAQRVTHEVHRPHLI